MESPITLKSSMTKLQIPFGILNINLKTITSYVRKK